MMLVQSIQIVGSAALSLKCIDLNLADWLASNMQDKSNWRDWLTYLIFCMYSILHLNGGVWRFNDLILLTRLIAEATRSSIASDDPTPCIAKWPAALAMTLQNKRVFVSTRKVSALMAYQCQEMIKNVHVFSNSLMRKKTRQIFLILTSSRSNAHANLDKRKIKRIRHRNNLLFNPWRTFPCKVFRYCCSLNVEHLPTKG